MSSFEELRDQWIHDHVPSATLSLHYVFEAAENRIAALEAELLKYKVAAGYNEERLKGQRQRAEAAEAEVERLRQSSKARNDELYNRWVAEVTKREQAEADRNACAEARRVKR